MKHNILLALSAIVLSIFRVGATEVTPGNVRDCLGADAATISQLTLTGSADARDLAFLASLPALRTLDMSALSIEAVQSDTAIILERNYFPAHTMPAYIFALSKLEKVVLPSSLLEIEDCAFASSKNLKEVVLGSKISRIGDWAFYATALTAVSLPSSVDSLGIGVYAHCSQLASAGLAATQLKTLPAKAFRGCSALKTITFPAGLAAIGSEALFATGMESLQLPQSLTSVGRYAFSHMAALKQAELPDATLGQGAFYANPQLTGVSGVSNYPELAMALCPQLILDSVAGMQITSLGDFALADNPTRKIWFSDRLTHVGKNALDGMENLINIMGYYMHGNIPETDEAAFSGLENIGNIKLWVDNDFLDSWRNHPQWGQFSLVGTTASVGGIEVDATSELSIDCKWNGNMLELASNEPLKIVAVYDTGGAVLAVARPSALNATIDMDGVDARIVVVRATTAAGAKTFKLRRRN